MYKIPFNAIVVLAISDNNLISLPNGQDLAQDYLLARIIAESGANPEFEVESAQYAICNGRLEENHYLFDLTMSGIIETDEPSRALMDFIANKWRVVNFANPDAEIESDITWDDCKSSFKGSEKDFEIWLKEMSRNTYIESIKVDCEADNCTTSPKRQSPYRHAGEHAKDCCCY